MDSIKQLEAGNKQSGRRSFLFGAFGMVGSYWYRWWRDRLRPIAQRETKFITENEDFYNVCINPVFEAKTSRESWRLEVVGLEGRRYQLNYAGLLSLEKRRVFKTFMCVENEVGGTSVGNAEWTVTPLAPLLAKVIPRKRDGLRVVFSSLDGFYSSVPLEVAASDQSFIAYEMNGEELPAAHGWPARVLLPNVYGMKQPRWLCKIEVTDRNESGYWEKRGWCGECNVRMTARVDSAMSQQDGKWLVTGMAYCGGQPVAKVEVSDDDGATWKEAKITTERLPNA
ncbi:MAG: molybdopterin-dependent oxidoreductase, partial [Blastocatellia bacterium]|nr:molybdopterin-dependent oxidoreductase [Blastocatellia bacterium]